MKTARKVSTRTTLSRPQPRPMADVSAMVFFPWPESWPLPTPEELAKDSRRRAAYLSGSRFWGRTTRTLTLGPKVQKGLFDA